MERLLDIVVRLRSGEFAACSIDTARRVGKHAVV